MEFHSLYFILVVIFALFISVPPRVDATPDEDEFVRVYGNDVNTSGIWPRANELAADDPALKHICDQVYKALWPWTRRYWMHDALVETKTLSFPGTEYQDINADFLLCEVRPPPAYSMLTKGLRPGCVFLCHKIGYGHPRVFKLANHTCNIEM